MSWDGLASSHCTPLKGSEHRLSDADLKSALAALPGWSLDDSGERIRREFAFDDYYRTLAFVNALAYIAHREDHHPDLGVHYNRCVVEFSTHDCGGVTRNDLICAAKASALYADRHGA
ncbi:4a-hydroxytetrahydrobiopterin dehydratase [Pseudomarimonas salicorniae]|uniref:Putative pterin-4-alpha-carbinolamine dehydratase n=1 Tax=Pseudomarimonas salicorniae TaxID=2933270 RepID=A0ABT0GK78_9GAMM|nr:4a-hydroxytetrahydrobiopterin dehydratase [Lysobacter sp. CAU 1642]MCK7594946.1 4a-hydroxytetrahydrobiopterin dehydratase [Lysobacter sp. CAU 1642]